MSDVIKIDEYVIAKDRMYLPSHEWAHEQEDGTWKMGISDYAQKMLREISYIQFEEVNEDFDEKEIICVVEALKATGDIYAPFDCTVIENNTKLDDNPELVVESPYEQGFLLRLKPRSDNRSNLISPEAYAEIVKKELDEF